MPTLGTNNQLVVVCNCPNGGWTAAADNLSIFVDLYNVTKNTVYVGAYQGNANPPIFVVPFSAFSTSGLFQFYISDTFTTTGADPGDTIQVRLWAQTQTKNSASILGNGVCVVTVTPAITA
jgi:hypothetical protein